MSGFTLLEMLLVLAIAGLMVTLVPPLFSNALPTLTLRGAAYDLAYELKRVRSQAITRNRRQEIRLFPEQGLYVTAGNRHSVPTDVSLDVRDAIVIDRMTGEQVVHFYPDGSSSGGRIILSDEDRRYQVEINWLTGQTLQREVGDEEG